MKLVYVEGLLLIGAILLGEFAARRNWIRYSRFALGAFILGILSTVLLIVQLDAAISNGFSARTVAEATLVALSGFGLALGMFALTLRVGHQTVVGYFRERDEQYRSAADARKATALRRRGAG